MVKGMTKETLDTEALMSRLVLASLVATAALALGGSAQASVLIYNVSFSGPNESPANASPGIGSVTTVNPLEIQDISGFMASV